MKRSPGITPLTNLPGVFIVRIPRWRILLTEPVRCYLFEIKSVISSKFTKEILGIIRGFFSWYRCNTQQINQQKMGRILKRNNSSDTSSNIVRGFSKVQYMQYYVLSMVLYFTFNFVFHPVAAFVHDETNKKKRLSEKTICMTSRHGDKNDLQHYNVHSLYGWSQTQPTLE